MARVLLIAGTHGSEEAWWQPGSPFVLALLGAGHVLAAPDDPFTWTTDVEGLFGGDSEWRESGKALAWYLLTHDVDTIVAHSHGGNVVAYALAEGRISVPRVVTVAMPVRQGMADVYARGRGYVIGAWIHIRGDGRDFWQRWGSRTWADWVLPWRWGRFERDLAVADCNIFEPGVGHGGLLDPDLWTRRNWWRFL